MPKKIKNKPELQEGKIKVVAPTNHDPLHNYPKFSFLHVCKNHCLLAKWQGSELTELIEALQTLEQLPWDKIKNHKGLNYKPVSTDSLTKPLPQEVSPDATICEFDVCRRKRVFGYRIGSVFRIIWFDREHEVIPYRKTKRA